MNDYNKTEYNREYNKDTYKTVKVYIREDKYPAIAEHMKTRGYTKLSGYIKDLIAQDMERTEEKQNKQIVMRDNNGKMILGDVNGDVHM